MTHVRTHSYLRMKHYQHLAHVTTQGLREALAYRHEHINHRIRAKNLLADLRYYRAQFAHWMHQLERSEAQP